MRPGYGGEAQRGGTPTSTGEVGATPGSKDWRRGGWRPQLQPHVPLAWQSAEGSEGGDSGAPAIPPPYAKAITRPGPRKGAAFFLL